MLIDNLSQLLYYQLTSSTIMDIKIIINVDETTNTYFLVPNKCRIINYQCWAQSNKE